MILNVLSVSKRERENDTIVSALSTPTQEIGYNGIRERERGREEKKRERYTI
jgi:hypothetical protein